MKNTIICFTCLNFTHVNFFFITHVQNTGDPCLVGLFLDLYQEKSLRSSCFIFLHLSFFFADFYFFLWKIYRFVLLGDVAIGVRPLRGPTFGPPCLPLSFSSHLKDCTLRPLNPFCALYGLAQPLDVRLRGLQPLIFHGPCLSHDRSIGSENPPISIPIWTWSNLLISIAKVNRALNKCICIWVVANSLMI